MYNSFLFVVSISVFIFYEYKFLFSMNINFYKCYLSGDLLSFLYVVHCILHFYVWIQKNVFVPDPESVVILQHTSSTTGSISVSWKAAISGSVDNNMLDIINMTSITSVELDRFIVQHYMSSVIHFHIFFSLPIIHSAVGVNPSAPFYRCL